MGVYECLIGIARDFGPGPDPRLLYFVPLEMLLYIEPSIKDNVKKAIKAVLKSAAMVQRGKRNADGVSGAEDVLDRELYSHLQDRFPVVCERYYCLFGCHARV